MNCEKCGSDSVLLYFMDGEKKSYICGKCGHETFIKNTEKEKIQYKKEMKLWEGFLSLFNKKEIKNDR